MNTFNVEYILNSLISPSIEVINQMTGLEPEKGDVEKKYDSIMSAGVTTILGITGKHKGRFFINMSFKTARAIAERINREEFEYIDDTVLYSITELSNIISGKAITLFNNDFKDYNLRLTPPGIFCGQGIEIAGSSLKVLSVTLKTEIGDIDINIGFEGVEM